MKYFLGALLAVLFWFCPSNLLAVQCSASIAQGSSESCDSVTQYGVTWNLDTSYTCGQFVSGDYWCVDPGSGVVVSSITPTPVAGTNGTQVNPKSDFATYGDYDYYESLIGTQYNYDATLQPSFPYTASAGDSIISTIEQVGAGTAWTGLSEDDSQLSTAAILTIVSSPPAAGSFRPGYCGTNKTLYNTSQIDLSVLRTLDTTGITLPSHAGFTMLEYYLRGLERPWILFGNDWQARPMHPILNMLDYHQHIGMFLGEAMLLLNTDQRTDELVNRFIQMGIDTYAMSINGRGDSAYFGQVVALTAALLNDSDMLNAYPSDAVVSQSRERQNFYEGVGWTGATALFKKDGNTYEETHPSTWVDNPDCKDETYRDGEDSQPQVGLNLAIMMSTRAKAALDYQVILDYADRFMTEEFTANYLPTVETYCPLRSFGGYQSSGSTFINEMWSTYRSNFEIIISFDQVSGTTTFNQVTGQVTFNQ